MTTTVCWVIRLNGGYLGDSGRRYVETRKEAYRLGSHCEAVDELAKCNDTWRENARIRKLTTPRRPKKPLPPREVWVGFNGAGIIKDAHREQRYDFDYTSVRYVLAEAGGTWTGEERRGEAMRVLTADEVWFLQYLKACEDDGMPRRSWKGNAIDSESQRVIAACDSLVDIELARQEDISDDGFTRRIRNHITNRGRLSLRAHDAYLASLIGVPQ